MKATITTILLTVFVQFVFAQNSLPVLNKGVRISISLNKKNTKGFDILIKDVSYRDSSQYSCKADITLVFSSRNTKVHFGSYRDMFDNYREGYSFNMFSIYDTLPKDSTIEKKVSLWIKKSQVGDSILTLGNYALMYIPPYDPTVYIRKEKEKQLAIQLAFKAKQDSIFKNSNAIDKKSEEIESRREKLLTPEYLAKWVGASFFTKENIERDCDVYPLSYFGGSVYYDFPKCPVTMEFTDKEHVCIFVSFRLFGEDGYNYKKSLIDYGYKLISKSSSLIAENNFRDLGNGKI